MVYSVQVSGQSVVVKSGTLSVDSKIGKRAQANFTSYDVTGNTHYQQYQQVQIYDQNSALAFAGFIDQPQEQKPGFSPTLETQISCMDMQWLAVKRLVAASYTNKTAGYIAQDLLNTILVQEGVTLGQIYDGLTPNTTLYPSDTLYPGGNVGLIPSAVFAYCTVAQAMDELVKAASDAGVPYYWQIDQYKQLWFVPYTAVIGPTIDGTTIDDGRLSGTVPRVVRANPLFRNTEYVTGGVAQTVTQNETRIGDSNTTAWPMGYALNSQPTITVNSVAKTVGITGVDTGKDFYWSKGDPLITQDSGAAKLTSSQTLAVSYIGQYPNTAVVQNSALVSYQASLDGTSGVIEVADQDAALTNAADAFTEASQRLTRYGVQATQFTFSTLESDFAAGQLITVNYAPFGFSNLQMIVEEVSASDTQNGLTIWYTITAIAGPYDIGWTDFFNKLLRSVAPANSINVGVSQSVNVAVNFTATITAAGTLTTTAFTCPVPATTLFPNTTLFPC